MGRYTLKDLFSSLTSFQLQATTELLVYSTNGLLMGTSNTETTKFITSAIYGYFYDDLVAYEGDTLNDVKDIFNDRFFYDIAIKLPYWVRKYSYIKTLLTDADLSLMQTSHMISESHDTSKSAGGSLQKGATTPTGVSVGGTTDSIDITIGEDSTDGDNDIETTGFVDKYTNYQQKYANANRVQGDRSGDILREGSIDELLKVLEKLPSSFADEITKDLQKHFIFDYDGEEKGIYEEDEQ